MLKQNQLEEKGLKVLRDCFSLIPNFEVIDTEILQNQTSPDLQILLKVNDSEKVIYLELKSLGTPKRVREAVNQLLIIQNNDPDSYGIVITPFISKRSAEICKQAGIGYIDLSGNCWISFDTIFLSRENMPNRYPTETSLSSLYAPKTERVLRVLLTFPFKNWKTTDLAEEADISLGMITHIRRRLEEEEWAEKQEVGFILSQPESLLEDWASQYDFELNKQYNFYTMKPLSEIETQIHEICTGANINEAVTGFSAANRLAPMVKGQKSTIYISQDISEVAEQAGLKSVDTGENITLIQPYDAGVLWDKRSVQGVLIATPVQIYLDLKQMRGRGDEAADFLFQEVIRKQWQHQLSNMTKS
jgi:hypothetical protein